jgi:hypothetical protein
LSLQGASRQKYLGRTDTEAIELARKVKFHVVFLDPNMPDSDTIASSGARSAIRVRVITSTTDDVLTEHAGRAPRF